MTRLREGCFLQHLRRLLQRAASTVSEHVCGCPAKLPLLVFRADFQTRTRFICVSAAVVAMVELG